MLESDLNKKTGANGLGNSSDTAILDVAIKEFSTLRSSGTSLEKIAELAGVKPALLTSYYKSIDALWSAAVTQLFDEAAEAMKKGLSDAGMKTPEAPIRGLVNGLLAFTTKRPQHFRILLLEEKIDNERHEWILKQSTASIFTISKMMIEQAQEAGVMRQGDPARIYYATVGLIISQFIWSTQYRQLTERDPFSTEEIDKVREMALDFLGS